MRDQYQELLQLVKARVEGARLPIFTTTVTGLYGMFLSALDKENQQVHNCRTCKKFVDDFGGLVTINSQGRVASLIWQGEFPPIFQESCNIMRHWTESSHVAGVFYPIERVAGKPITVSTKYAKVWTHFSGEWWIKALGEDGVKQAAAVKLEEYGMLSRGLNEYPVTAFKEAERLLKSGQLFRSEKAVAIAEWARDLSERHAEAKNAATKNNIVFLAAAAAPAGFAHIKTTIISTLLDGIVLGNDFDDIKRSWGMKLAPDQYMRPTAEVSEVQIDIAEKKIVELGLTASLRRRFATLGDMSTFWSPTTNVAAVEDKAGVFDHLRKINKVNIVLPPQTMTWAKFRDTILPRAKTLDLFIETSQQPYAAFVTAADAKSKPILVWDNVEKRNPVSWYLHLGGSLPEAWALSGGAWHPVTGLCYSPAHWQGEMSNQSDKVFVLLEDAYDRSHSAGGGFFIETLKSELREIRKVMEHHANSATIEDLGEENVAGLMLTKGLTWKCQVRVNGTDCFILDRWD